MTGACGTGCRGCTAALPVPTSQAPRFRAAARRMTFASALGLGTLAVCVGVLEAAQAGPGTALALLLGFLAAGLWRVRRHRSKNFQGGHHA